MPDATRLVVIGAGPGGYTAAFHAADLGMRVTLVDESPRLGGVCLQRGCIPSKALLHAAGVIGDARRAARWGVAFGAPAIDLDRLRGWKDEVVSALTGGLGRLAQQRAVTFLQGRAAFADPHKVMVEPAGGGEPLGVPFDYAIVATGSRPVRPAALALDDPRVMDSTGALEIARASGSLLVVGGGYIGLELGAVYAALGCTVTVVEMTAGTAAGRRRRSRAGGRAPDGPRAGRRAAAHQGGGAAVAAGRYRGAAGRAGRTVGGPPLRPGAGGGRPLSELAHRRARADGGGAGRPRIRRGRRAPADRGAVDIRHRRRRR